MIWQYNVVPLTGGYIDQGETLARLGRLDWELVAVDHTKGLAYLKRRADPLEYET